jgi:pimeloyl-ACP methyl ester carboxylesterase
MCSDYGMTAFGLQTIALLDHAGIDQAVVGGTSLGANVTLEAAAAAPERVKGMLIEMPVLDNALLACALAFTPLLVGLTFGAPIARFVGAGARLLPRGNSLLADMVLDWVSQDPKPSASVLQGLFYGRVAPPREERARMSQRTLVIGHYRDPIHPFSDSDMLVRELPNARLLEASSILELRLTPERLTSEITHFVEECFKAAPRDGARSRAKAPAKRSARQRRQSS